MYCQSDVRRINALYPHAWFNGVYLWLWRTDPDAGALSGASASIEDEERGDATATATPDKNMRPMEKMEIRAAWRNRCDRRGISAMVSLSEDFEDVVGASSCDMCAARRTSAEG